MSNRDTVLPKEIYSLTGTKECVREMCRARSKGDRPGAPEGRGFLEKGANQNI